MSVVDLRSDTVTLPSPAMREAMFEAELGDDIYGEDPTVNRLEAMAADMMGKEAALFVASGTMGNLISVLSHCGRGDEVIMGDCAHTFLYEAGGVSALGGVHVHTVPNRPDGTMLLTDIEGAIRAENMHFPPTKLICLENTHNRCGGAVLPVSYMAAVRELANKYSLPVHLDGARVFNASVALGVDVREIVDHVDSIQFCLSKGLSAPVGSMVCGASDFVARARRLRKLVGGAMRQAGVLAAAGIVGLEEMIGRLADDHANAKALAAGLDEMDAYTVDVDSVETDIVMFGMSDPAVNLDDVVTALAANGVKLNRIDATRFRAVTHYGIEAKDIETALTAMAEVAAAL